MWHPLPFSQSARQWTLCQPLRLAVGVQILWCTLICSAYSDQNERFFERHVRPILIDHCVGCHGPNVQEGGLRLDTRTGVFQGGDSGPAVMPGQAEKSLLITAIRRTEDRAMPPEEALAPKDIESLRQWIADGAFWPSDTDHSDSLVGQHWSLMPIQEPRLPVDPDSNWPHKKVDALLLKRLVDQQLTPSPQVTLRTLIRRLSYDLKGLPPELDEIERVLEDSSPDAISRLVDRFMASPRYGEHWARHWMDVARYADNKGYVFFEQSEFPWAFTYRDYVIRALNQDRPYDRFVMEQLAADKLDDLESPADMAALGFITVGGHFVNNTHDIIDDRIDVVTRGLMGLTATCARCHDHKYDPISQADYYALYGIFQSCSEPIVPPPLDPATAAELTDYNSTLNERHRSLIDFVSQKYETLIAGSRRRVDEYLIAVDRRRTHPSAEEFMLIADPEDINPAMITRWEAYLSRTAKPAHPIWGPWAVALEQTPPRERLDLESTPAEIASKWNPLLVSRLQSEAPKSIEDLANLYGLLFREIDDEWQAIGKTQDAAPLTNAAREALRIEIYGKDTPSDLPPKLDWGFLSLFPDRATQNEYKRLLKSLEEWLVDPAEAPDRAMALVDDDQPEDARVFLRGNPNQLGERVPRRFLQLLDPEQTAFEEGSGRKELAEAIVSPTNPLPDRVLSNRIWMHLMGQPFVNTPADFGLRSDPPTLPRVMDQTVVEFRRRGRSQKALIRHLVLTRTYQQASRRRPEAEAIDPENRFRWRQEPKRLQFEAMRDSLLVAANRLSPRVGGPSQDLINQLGHHRTIYGFINRLDVPPVLTTFDFPNPAATSPMRQRTTVPPQALFWMNEPHMLTIAEELVSRPDIVDLAAKAKLEKVALILWGRTATDEELEWAFDFLDASPEDPSREVAGSVSPETWQALIHALLMSNETVFID